MLVFAVSAGTIHVMHITNFSSSLDVSTLHAMRLEEERKGTDATALVPILEAFFSSPPARSPASHASASSALEPLRV